MTYSESADNKRQITTHENQREKKKERKRDEIQGTPRLEGNLFLFHIVKRRPHFPAQFLFVVYIFQDIRERERGDFLLGAIPLPMQFHC